MPSLPDERDPEELRKTIVHRDDKTYELTIKHLPISILSNILTQAALYNHQEEATKKIEQAFGAGPCNCEDCRLYNDRSLSYIRTLEELIKGSDDREYRRESQRQFTQEELDTYLSQSLAHDRKRRKELTEHQDDPLPDFPRVQMFIEARGHSRKAVDLISNASYSINAMLQGNKYHSGPDTASRFRRAAEHLIACATKLEEISQLPEEEFEIVIKDPHPTVFEAGV